MKVIPSHHSCCSMQNQSVLLACSFGFRIKYIHTTTTTSTTNQSGNWRRENGGNRFLDIVTDLSRSIQKCIQFIV